MANSRNNTSEKSCPNCSRETIGDYCHYCGQSTKVSRITWRSLFSELQTRLFGFDNRFMRTVKDLTLRPDVVIRTVIEGVRVRYFGPISYYFLLITIYAILVSMLDIDLSGFSRSIAEEIDPSNESSLAIQEQFNGIIFANFRVFSFLMVPLFSLGTYLLFYKKKFNFLETSVLVFYGMGHPTILSILALFLYQYSAFTTVNAVLPIVSALYFGWTCARFYSGNKFWNFFKGIFSMIIAFGMIMFLAIIGFVVYILINPEVMETLQ